VFSQSDDKLISKALGGNRAAWLKLVKRYEKLVFNYALRMVSNRDDAMDLMQDTFLAVFRGLASFRGDSAFNSWLLKIAHYRCIEFYRKRKHTVDIEGIPEVFNEDGEDCPELSVVAGQQGDQLIGAMSQLPVNQRAVIEMKFFQYLTFEDIAQQLGVSTNTVKSRLYAGLGKMKQMLEVADVNG
jgi:RNA polymerase sigma-70 factor (ECF subfamily)